MYRLNIFPQEIKRTTEQISTQILDPSLCESLKDLRTTTRYFENDILARNEESGRMFESRQLFVTRTTDRLSNCDRFEGAPTD